MSTPSPQQHVRIRWALSWLKGYRLPFALILLLMLVEASTGLLLPYLVKHFIDDYAKMSRTALAGSAGLLLFAAAASVGLHALRSRRERLLQERIAGTIQWSMYAKLHTLGFDYHDRHPAGQTTGLLQTEVGALGDLYRISLPGLLRHGAFACLYVLFLCGVSLRLTLILIPALLLFYAVSPWLNRRIGRANRRWADERVQLYRKLHESFSAVLELRTNGGEAWDHLRVEQREREHTQTILSLYMTANARSALRMLVFYGGMVGAVLYGIHEVRAGRLTVGAVSAFLLTYFPAMEHLTAFLTCWTESRLRLGQIQPLYELDQLKPAIQESEAPHQQPIVHGELEFRDVIFSYAFSDSRPVLDGITLRIEPGQRVALVGPSGEGKSTLLKLIPRFYDPAGGSILLDGVDLRKWSLAQLRESVGFVFQEPQAFGTTIRDNLRFAKPDASDEELEEAARAAAAHDFIRALPEGYDTYIGERGVRLSGGQKQRLSLARLYLKNPPILILDEATSSLDHGTERQVTYLLRGLLGKRTVLAAAHRLSTIADYDRIVYLEGGRIVETGTYDELMLRGGAFARLAAGEIMKGGCAEHEPPAMDVAVLKGS